MTFSFWNCRSAAVTCPGTPPGRPACGSGRDRKLSGSGTARSVVRAAGSGATHPAPPFRSRVARPPRETKAVEVPTVHVCTTSVIASSSNPQSTTYPATKPWTRPIAWPAEVKYVPMERSASRRDANNVACRACAGQHPRRGRVRPSAGRSPAKTAVPRPDGQRDVGNRCPAGRNRSPCRPTRASWRGPPGGSKGARRPKPRDPQREFRPSVRAGGHLARPRIDRERGLRRRRGPADGRGPRAVDIDHSEQAEPGLARRAKTVDLLVDRGPRPPPAGRRRCRQGPNRKGSLPGRHPPPYPPYLDELTGPLPVHAVNTPPGWVGSSTQPATTSGSGPAVRSTASLLALKKAAACSWAAATRASAESESPAPGSSSSAAPASAAASMPAAIAAAAESHVRFNARARNPIALPSPPSRSARRHRPAVSWRAMRWVQRSVY